ncbi:hypothetical protein HHL16_22135 [Pseudoflavitalea sp. G-6-1-2]|uniref:IPT/TIG domain-containing protein n=1 Tax=Pseudoflavitalea sp. G-6-1-2 TaxID=2728841 RepID=UPI00146A4221|nr:IPT/TIG domain-containing protein [Pseudoflavitalea sp. G-6-1-2]NML23595.1 hypothetical protein [Pseudoflavitalea sp. G-6-1-2]
MKRYFGLLALMLILAFACKKDNHENAKPAFAVKAFWPNGGNAGTIVTIRGQGFGAKASDNEVSFNGTIATVVSRNDSTLMVQAPANGSTGTLSVKVADKKIDAGTYTYQQLTVKNVYPLNGPAGTNIRISGEGFGNTGAPAKVMVNGKEAIITDLSDTLLIAAVPEAAGSGSIKVFVNGKEVTGPGFSFQHISGIKPLKGGAGTEVTILGEGFSTDAANNLIAFNGKPAEVLSASNGKLVVKAPAEVATGSISVTINGQKTSGNVFTVVPKPVLKTVTPLSAPAGRDIEFTGEYFSEFADEINITFNGKPATIVVSAEKKMTVKVPAGAGAGNILVTVNGQQTGGPLFKEQSLGVVKLTPDNGLTGTDVTIAGMGFGSLTADNQVFFNGVAATVVSATESELKVKAPAAFTTGAITVKAGGLDATGPVFRRAGVITIAGNPSANEFSYPEGIAVDASGNVFVSDGNLIKKVTPNGTVSVFAGSTTSGFADDMGPNARFNFITTLAMGENGILYALDVLNRRVRQITSDGNVKTFAILGFTPTGMGVDKNNVVYVGSQYSSIYRLDALGNATKVSNTYESATGLIAIDNAGQIFYNGDYSYNDVFHILPDGRKEVFAGSTSYGSVNGPYRSAMFGTLNGTVIDRNSGIMHVVDGNGIRVLADGMVSTLTGWSGGLSPVSGYKDGTLNEAKFWDIKSLCIDKEGNIYVIERNNKAVRKIIMK